MKNKVELSFGLKGVQYTNTEMLVKLIGDVITPNGLVGLDENDSNSTLQMRVVLLQPSGEWGVSNHTLLYKGSVNYYDAIHSGMSFNDFSESWIRGVLNLLIQEGNHFDLLVEGVVFRPAGLPPVEEVFVNTTSGKGGTFYTGVENDPNDYRQGHTSYILTSQESIDVHKGECVRHIPVGEVTIIASPVDGNGNIPLLTGHCTAAVINLDEDFKDFVKSHTYEEIENELLARIVR